LGGGKERIKNFLQNKWNRLKEKVGFDNSKRKIAEEKVSEPFPGEDVGLRPTNFGFKPRTVDINDPKLLEDADKLVGEVYKYFDSTISTISKRKRGPVLAGVMHRAGASHFCKSLKKG
jgi:hypothetical protein